MNHIIESLERNKDKVKYATFGPNGYALYMHEESFGVTSKLSGYGKINDEVREYLKANSVPATDTTTIPEKAKFRVAYNLPLIGDDMREGPITGMSKASFEVYANLTRINGATTYNVRDINFVPEMFGKLTKEQVNLLGSMHKGGQAFEEAVGDYIVNKTPTGIWNPELSEKTDSFARYLDKIIGKTHSDFKEKVSEIEESIKGGSFRDEGYMDKFSEKLGYQSAANLSEQISNAVTWSALMVEAGNIDEAQAWKEAKEVVDAIMQDLTKSAKQYSVETHGNIHHSLKLMKPVAAQFNKVVSRFTGKSAETDMQP